MGKASYSVSEIHISLGTSLTREISSPLDNTLPFSDVITESPNAISSVFNF
ncbi:hypothetical protein [Intestinibacter sp.]|uniref:hypothetical protein n=1 Tax=Intestinibacter sp. TaxID=1965304 RepID=UPI003F145817